MYMIVIFNNSHMIIMIIMGMMIYLIDLIEPMVS